MGLRVLVTGACGFVGSTLIRAWLDKHPQDDLYGIDNLSRPGSELNRTALRRLGVDVIHGDIRAQSDLEVFPSVDWVISAAALPHVTAGVFGQVTSRQVSEHNLISCVNMLEFCKQRSCGFVLLSTSRVYSIPPLQRLQLHIDKGSFVFVDGKGPDGVSPLGVSEAFSTDPPVSLYGATKLACERLALEYGESFEFPVWVNRCGVMAGAGQFGRPDQGIFSYWLNSWFRNRPLSYRGFGGKGCQVRDCLHPRDLLSLIEQQVGNEAGGRPHIVNVSGGVASAISLRQLSDWCTDMWGAREVQCDLATHELDVPWLVLDSSKAANAWDWSPAIPLADVLTEIAGHAEANPQWLEWSGQQ